MSNLTIDLTLPNVEVKAPNIKIREFLTPIPGNDEDYLLVLDNTGLEHFTKCPTSALNYLIYRREAHARNASLTFGGAIHEGIRLLLLGKNPQEQDRAIVQYFAENPTAPDEYRTVNMALRVMAYYRAQDVPWDILCDKEGNKLIEKGFEIPLGVLEFNDLLRLPQWGEHRYVANIHVAWSGRIDTLAHVGSCNRIVDHKTTSVFGDDYVQSFQLANQTRGYVWVARKLWPYLDIKGFCLNVIALRKVPSDAVPLVQLGPRGGAPPLQFSRSFFEYSDSSLDDWENDALTIATDLIHCLRRNQFPQYTSSCFNKFGRCQFWQACTIEDKSLRHKFLMSDTYKPVTWDPCAY